MMTSKEQQQIEREEQMRTLGVIRYERQMAERDLADLPPGTRMLFEAIDPLAQHVAEWVEETGKNPRRYGKVLHFVKLFQPEEIAYIALRRVINAVSERTKLGTLAMSVANLLKDADQANRFRAKDKKQFDVVQDWVKEYSAGKAQGVLRRAMVAAEIPDTEWSYDERLQLGLKVVELIQGGTGFIETVTMNEGPNNTTTYVVGTEKLQKWLESSHEKCKLLSPMYLPMVCKPRDWVAPNEGGYYTMQVSLVRTRNKGFKEELETWDMPQVYAAVNRLQNTAWRINAGVFRVMKEAREMGGGIAGIPKVEGEPIPVKPLDIETNELARKEYSKACSRVMRSNLKNGSKVRALVQKLWVAEEYLEEETLYFPHSLDWRGRAYPIPSYVNPQSDDAGKALLMFAEGKRLGDNGAYWLAVHIANCFGYDKASFDERVQWVLEHEAQIMDSAMNGLSGERFWVEADSPFCFLAGCLEWMGYRMTGEDYVSHLPIQMDGSCNGLQNFSAMLLDPIGGKATNLVPSEKPSDIYGEVAKVAAVMVLADAEKGVKEAIALVGKVTRKLTKRNCMTFVYGVTAWGMRDQLAVEIQDLIGKGQLDLGDDADAWNTAAYLSKINVQAIGQVVVAAKQAMDWLQEVAKVVAQDGLPVNWVSPIGFPVQQHYRETIGKRVNVTYMGHAQKITVAREGDKLNSRRQALGIAPNFVHSCDAAHMMRTINTAADMGVTHFSFIHDSFGCHAGDMDTLAQALRVAFVEQYSGDVLGDFYVQLVTQLESTGSTDLVKNIPPVPKRGTLDLQGVLESDYFFA